MLVAAASAQSGGSPPGTTPGTPDPTAALTASQLVGQRMIFSYDGTTPPSGLRRRIAAGEAAGIILFADNVGSRARLRATLRGLQAIRRPAAVRAPLLVMIDQEGGLVKRLSGAPSRSPAELGRIGSADLARREGRATAANLRDVGVNVNLGAGRRRRPARHLPGADRALVLLESHPRVGDGGGLRRGLQERGVAATLKHFPGLGTVFQDEDAVAQTVRLPLATLRRIDESPFVAGARAGSSS